MTQKRQSKRFTYRVAYYDRDEQAKSPTTRSVSTINVEATSVDRAINRAFATLGLDSRRDWHVVSVTPILDEVSARRYQV